MSRWPSRTTRHHLASRIAGLAFLAGVIFILLPARHEALAQATPAESAASESAAPETPPKPSKHLDLRRMTPVTGSAQAGKARADELCSICHGAHGIANAPLFPSLAPQSAEYLYWELVEYKRGARPESPMAPLTDDLTDQDMRDLAVFYAGLKPTAADVIAAVGEPEAKPDPELLARGKSLFLAGDPGKGIPPCQACHGADARGHPLARVANRDGHLPYAAYPALRAQHDVYLQARLGAYRDGLLKDSSNDRIMSGVAERLDEDSIQAISAWLSSLQP